MSLDEILDELDDLKDENQALRRENNLLREENEQQLADLKQLLSINKQMKEHLTIKPEGILSGTLLGSEYGQHEPIHNLSSNLYTGEKSKQIGTSKHHSRAPHTPETNRPWGAYSLTNDIHPEGGMSGNGGIKLKNVYSTKFSITKSNDDYPPHQQLWGNVADNTYKPQNRDIPTFQDDIQITDKAIRFSNRQPSSTNIGSSTSESKSYPNSREGRKRWHNGPYIEPVD
jgi:hypothetical protein